jgi:hypothetical protein
MLCQIAAVGKQAKLSYAALLLALTRLALPPEVLSSLSPNFPRRKEHTNLGRQDLKSLA